VAQQAPQAQQCLVLDLAQPRYPFFGDPDVWENMEQTWGKPWIFPRFLTDVDGF
jgi:hypothetical protein